MVKEIAVGSTVEKISDHFSRYNPYHYLERHSYNLTCDDQHIVSKIKGINTKVDSELNKLYRDMLRFRKGNVTLLAGDIIRIIQEEYKPLVYALKSDKALLAKSLFDEWGLEWMLNYLQYSNLCEDEIFAEINYIPVTKEIKNKLRDMRIYYFDESEIIEEWGEDYLDDDYDVE